MTEEVIQTVSQSQPAPVAQRIDHEPETFSKTYVRELREEAKSYRLAKDEAVKAAQEAKAAAEVAIAAAKAAEEKAAADTAAARTAAEAAANDRIIRAELKAEAIKAGLVDIDALKMLDTSSVTLDDQGNPTGAAELFAALKESKPYLFTAAPVHSSQTQPPPPAPKPSDKKSAKDMTPEEFAAARRAVASGKLP